jgi:hypothetical protein
MNHDKQKNGPKQSDSSKMFPLLLATRTRKSLPPKITLGGANTVLR